MKSKLFASALFFVNFCFAFLLDTRFLNTDALLAGELEKDLSSFADSFDEPLPRPPLASLLQDPIDEPLPRPPLASLLQDPIDEPLPRPPLASLLQDPIDEPLPRPPLASLLQDLFPDIGFYILKG